MSDWHVYTAVFTAQLSFLISSTCLTWSSPMLIKLNGTDDNPLGRRITDTENSLLASLPILGACLGSIICVILASKFGRKTILLACGVPFLVFYLVLAWATNIWFFYVSRLCTGIGIGASFAIVPIYSTEVANVKNRGILGASMAVFINIGILITYCVGPNVSYFCFHIILAILPAIYIVLLYFCAPESPYYLIQHDYSKARQVLEKLRDVSEVDRNLEEMKRDLENSTDASLMDIFSSKGLRKAFILGLGMATFMQLTGTGIVATYTQTIFEDAQTDIPSKYCPIIIGVAQFITTVLVSAVTDKFPRKFLLITSHLGVALTQIPFGIYFYLKDKHEDVSQITWLPLVCLVIFVILYNIGIGPLVYTSLGELFPLEIKGKIVSALICYHWIDVFLLTLLFNSLKNSLGMGVLLWISSCLGIFAAIFIKFLMVETRGKTFEEIQRKLNA